VLHVDAKEPDSCDTASGEIADHVRRFDRLRIDNDHRAHAIGKQLGGVHDVAVICPVDHPLLDGGDSHYVFLLHPLAHLLRGGLFVYWVWTVHPTWLTDRSGAKRSAFNRIKGDEVARIALEVVRDEMC